ncbi:DUF6432 family protein [Halanaeroarchaeum sulfurireducens]|uniref:MarR family transcriptional regulator n=1 Tax=Halanaeroarchaeum sulfurireducens TaxID=1604004 RepID=A0A0F7PB62_9EURY|nr:DUF6432 family protein [Halanaeroarchaeum sulfurireducens]AKH96874.1 hypothetical protein HLASF_0368 [Halanaeroarchaeum sulfurireducens]ALG81276.1 hypothetical protein HLASA_0367 [Halanaeroarchaeum sulfurireducens]
MSIRRELRQRDDVEVTILDALADRREEGMTVFELRSHVDVDIDELERGLANLKSDGLVDAESNGHRTVILVDDRAIPDEPVTEDASILDAILERLGL